MIGRTDTRRAEPTQSGATCRMQGIRDESTQPREYANVVQDGIYRLLDDRIPTSIASSTSERAPTAFMTGGKPPDRKRGESTKREVLARHPNSWNGDCCGVGAFGEVQVGGMFTGTVQSPFHERLRPNPPFPALLTQFYMISCRHSKTRSIHVQCTSCASQGICPKGCSGELAGGANNP
jgi:hypothetical protein